MTRVQSHIGLAVRSVVLLLLIVSRGGAQVSGSEMPQTPVSADSTREQSILIPSSLDPDDRFKADILVVVAHPDDETEISAYLAKAMDEEHRRVAIVFGTRGDGGGNAMGFAQAASLGAEREIEARRACAYLGIANVWFLDGPDTPSQNVLYSLETWNHGAVLSKAVRIMRLTRPEVVLTWLPSYVAGENHGDHQAAGVVATEAFDLAGDPTQFPEQVSFPRDRKNIGNLTEGLAVWQPRKIYYFSDASHREFLEGQGPQYSRTGISPIRKLPYYRIAAEEMAFHLTQDDTGQEAKRSLEQGKFESFERPVQLVFGKSLVGGTIAGDVFEAVGVAPIPFAPVRRYRPEPSPAGLALELGGSWRFYRDFWRVHNIERLAQLLPTPEVSLQAGETLHIPLLIRNGSSEPEEVILSAALPGGWKEKNGSGRYRVAAHGVYPVEAAVQTVPTKEQQWQTIIWKAQTAGKTMDVKVRVNVTLDGGLPQ